MKRSAADFHPGLGESDFLSEDDLPDPPRTVAELVYRRFRHDILLGKLAPGAALRSNDLRREYEVGISPLREALSRLVSEKLVTISGQRGFRVAPVTAEDVYDTMEMRIVIESEAIARSVRSGGVAWESNVVGSLHTLSRTELPTAAGDRAGFWARQHRRFHMALVDGCGSPWMMSLARSLFDHAERHRAIAIAGRESRPAGDEHQQVVEAALDGNVKATVAAIDHHYRTTADMVAKFISEGAGKASD